VRELSLHILDLMENSIRAGASVIAVTLIQEQAQDRLTISVEDNGFGIQQPAKTITDPFFSTKPGKRTGLGISLFKAAAERADGKLSIEKSSLGGACIKVSMRLTHIDRNPLGDLAATLSSVVCTNPGLEVICRLRCGDQECVVQTSDMARELPGPHRGGLGLARLMSDKIKTSLMTLQFQP
jgi:anti-sigma regulatory factor (Ser/Thr protein kinase)